MEKVRPWCGQPSDRGRLRNRTELVEREFLAIGPHMQTLWARVWCHLLWVTAANGPVYCMCFMIIYDFKCFRTKKGRHVVRGGGASTGKDQLWETVWSIRMINCECFASVFCRWCYGCIAAQQIAMVEVHHRLTTDISYRDGTFYSSRKHIS